MINTYIDVVHFLPVVEDIFGGLGRRHGVELRCYGGDGADCERRMDGGLFWTRRTGRRAVNGAM